ncbi:MAG: M20 family peptidase [Pseudomonadota bacterium]
MLKPILYGVGSVCAALVLLLVIVIVRTLNYGGASDSVQEITLTDVAAFDADLIAERLGEAIRFKTQTVIPGDPLPGREGPWLDMQAWIEATYPAFHDAAQKETIPGGYSLLYTWQGSDTSLAPLLLMAHQDVVPVNMGTEGDWDAPPFSGAVQNGFIYGRGAIDNKGAMIAQFEALDALARDGFQPRRTILFMLGHDEEVSGSGAGAGIELVSSRGLIPEMVLDEGFMAISDNPLTGAPLAFIGVAEKGYLTVEITASAEGGHSSTPPRDSAAVRLSRALLALEENQMPSDLSQEPVKTLLASAAPDMPFMQRMAFANSWLFGGVLEGVAADSPAFNAMIRTTTAPTMLVGSAKENVLAQRATAIVNFRIHPRDTEDDIINHVERVTRHIDGLTIKRGTSGIRGAGASPVSPINNRAFAVLHAVAEDATGGASVAPGLVLGATDSRYANAITDNVYRFMPAIMTLEETRGFHGTNERISVENMGRMARGYTQIILAMDEGN